MNHAKFLLNDFQKENRFEVILKINRYKKTECFEKLKILNANEQNYSIMSEYILMLPEIC